ncbi:MAG TPA: hypothetical protein VHC22_28655 [Pirellulales bacterium]|nr:hypothetical protein [Pirellulales bacterium]
MTIPGWKAFAAAPDTSVAGVANSRQDERATHNADWRYSFHNGRWWYWLPSNSWAYHNGRSWVRYNPARSIAEEGRNRVSPMRYSSYSAPVPDPERYQAGQPPSAPPANLGEIQQQLAQTQARLRQLEARVGAQERTTSGSTRMSAGQAAQLSELWRARQADAQFYDYGTDYWFMHGKGHFTD